MRHASYIVHLLFTLCVSAVGGGILFPTALFLTDALMASLLNGKSICAELEPLVKYLGLQGYNIGPLALAVPLGAATGFFLSLRFMLPHQPSTK